MIHEYPRKFIHLNTCRSEHFTKLNKFIDLTGQEITYEWYRNHNCCLNLFSNIFKSHWSIFPEEKILKFYISFFNFNLFIFLDASGHIKLWDYTTGSCLNTMTENRQSLNVTYSSDGLRFVTTGETPELFVYDRTTRKKILTLEPRYR